MNHTRELLLGLLVQVGDGQTGSQEGIVGVVSGHGGCRLRCQVIQLNSGYTTVDATDHLKRDAHLDGNYIHFNSTLIK